MLYALIAVCALCVFLLVACYALCKQREQAYKLARDERSDCIRAEEACDKAEERISQLESLRDAYAEQVSDLNDTVSSLQERLDQYESADDDSDDDAWSDSYADADDSEDSYIDQAYEDRYCE